jgi:hypothetical protein
MAYRFALVSILALLTSGCFPYAVCKSPCALGYVLDDETKAPVVGATVSFPSGLSTKTDENGWFDVGQRSTIVMLVPFDPVPPPPASLLIEAPGYEILETSNYSSFGRRHLSVGRRDIFLRKARKEVPSPTEERDAALPTQ